MPREYVLDANLAVLLIVGSLNSEDVASHPRLNGYDEDDFEILKIWLNGATVVVSPHVLAETSNLLGHRDDRYHRDLAVVFRLLVLSFSERNVPAIDATARPEFARLGLTDAVLLTLSSTGGTLLTADGPLFTAALAAGCNAQHFETLRSYFHTE